MIMKTRLIKFDYFVSFNSVLGGCTTRGRVNKLNLRYRLKQPGNLTTTSKLQHPSRKLILLSKNFSKKKNNLLCSKKWTIWRTPIWIYYITLQTQKKTTIYHQNQMQMMISKRILNHFKKTRQLIICLSKKKKKMNKIITFLIQIQLIKWLKFNLVV